MGNNSLIERERKIILEFLQWNDRNGCYTDENCEIEQVPILSYEEAIKHFFGVINEDEYYEIVDNIFELSYEEVINYSKDKGFYEKTNNKLKELFDNNGSDLLYRSLL